MLFIGVFDGSVLLYFSTFQIIARFIEKEIWDINQFRGVLSLESKSNNVPYLKNAAVKWFHMRCACSMGRPI